MVNGQEQPGGNKDKTHENEHAHRESGPQGIDKAPGEEPSQDNVQFTQEAFKGKKVDRDPDDEQDDPADQPSI